MGTIVPSTVRSDAQQSCDNGLILKSVIAGVGSALGVQIPGSDHFGDMTGAVKHAAKNPVVVATASAMAARLGGELLTRANALALGNAVSTKFAPIVAATATVIGIYSAVSDGVDYFNAHEAACQDAK